MKQRLLIMIGCIILPLGLYSQTSCDEYIRQIDSLVKVDAVFLNTMKKDSTIRPVKSCETALFDYAKDKGYIGDSVEFSIKNILFYISYYGSSRELREKAIDALLDRSYAYRTNTSYQWNKEDLNAEAKLHLIRLLKREYTPVEIERYVKDFKKYSYKYHPLDSVAKYIALENKQDFQHVKDSIQKADYEEPKKRLIEEEGYNNILPLLIGWYDMKEYIPLLDSMYRADKNVAIAMSLARLGVKEYQQYFENAKVVYRDVAFYIGTQEMIYKYGKEVLSDRKKQYLWSDSPEAGPVLIALDVIINLQKYIEGFPHLIDDNLYVYVPKYAEAISLDVFQQANQWMEENKGHYKLKEFYPAFTPDMYKEYDENEDK